jgi:ribosomal-protein-alanine N-acetyltransferase
VSKYWPVTLRQGQITLRPIRSRDFGSWQRIRNQSPEWFRPWDSTRPGDSTEPGQTFVQLVKSYRQRARRGSMLPWAVDYSPEPGAAAVFAGQVTVSGISRGSACWGMIGYWIDPQWAGRGIIPLAVAMACDYCFNSAGLHRLEIAIRPENTNSLAVVRKVGFRYEGPRERYMHVAGDWRDHQMFVLYAGDIPEGVVNRLLG